MLYRSIICDLSIIMGCNGVHGLFRFPGTSIYIPSHQAPPSRIPLHSCRFGLRIVGGAKSKQCHELVYVSCRGVLWHSATGKPPLYIVTPFGTTHVPVVSACVCVVTLNRHFYSDSHPSGACEFRTDIFLLRYTNSVVAGYNNEQRQLLV